MASSPHPLIHTWFPPWLNLPVLSYGVGETSGVRAPAVGERLRLVLDQAPWEMRTERPVIRLPPWHPSPLPAGLSFLLAYSTPAPSLAAMWAGPQISVRAGPRTEKRRENSAGRVEAWKRCLGWCCLHTAQVGQLRPEGLQSHLSGVAWGVMGTWVMTGHLGPQHSSSPEAPSHATRHLTYLPHPLILSLLAHLPPSQGSHSRRA